MAPDQCQRKKLFQTKENPQNRKDQKISGAGKVTT